MRMVYNANGQLVGKLDEGSFGQLGVYDKNGNKLGMYIQGANYTLDENGRMVGKGDQRMLLLGQES